MNIIDNYQIDDKLSLRIIEYDDLIIINNFTHRCQIFLNYKNKKNFIPKSKLKYTELFLNDNEINQNIFILNSDINNTPIYLNPIQYYTKHIFDKTYDECISYVNNILQNNNHNTILSYLLNDYNCIYLYHKINHHNNLN